MGDYFENKLTRLGQLLQEDLLQTGLNLNFRSTRSGVNVKRDRFGHRGNPRISRNSTPGCGAVDSTRGDQLVTSHNNVLRTNLTRNNESILSNRDLINLIRMNRSFDQMVPICADFDCDMETLDMLQPSHGHNVNPEFGYNSNYFTNQMLPLQLNNQRMDVDQRALLAANNTSRAQTSPQSCENGENVSTSYQQIPQIPDTRMVSANNTISALISPQSHSTVENQILFPNITERSENSATSYQLNLQNDISPPPDHQQTPEQVDNRNYTWCKIESEQALVNKSDHIENASTSTDNITNNMRTSSPKIYTTQEGVELILQRSISLEFQKYENNQKTDIALIREKSRDASGDVSKGLTNLNGSLPIDLDEERMLLQETQLQVPREWSTASNPPINHIETPKKDLFEEALNSDEDCLFQSIDLDFVIGNEDLPKASVVEKDIANVEEKIVQVNIRANENDLKHGEGPSSTPGKSPSQFHGKKAKLAEDEKPMQEENAKIKKVSPKESAKKAKKIGILASNKEFILAKPQCKSSSGGRQLKISDMFAERAVYGMIFEQETAEMSEQPSTSSGNRKCRFRPPTQRTNNNSEYTVISLDCKTCPELEKKLEHDPIEICFNLYYRNGITQLTDPTALGDRDAASAMGIFVRVEWSSDPPIVLFYDLYMVGEDQPDFSAKRQLLCSLLDCLCRKVCYDAKTFLVTILTRFRVPEADVRSKWFILDPMIAHWLMSPDQPKQSFETTLGFLNGSGSYSPPRCVGGLMNQLSFSIHASYKMLSKKGLWSLFLEMETRILSILAAMEFWGILGDREEFKRYSAILDSGIKKAEQDTWAAAGKMFQIHSPLQLRNIIYDQLKLDQLANVTIKETTLIKAKSTSEAMLKQLVRVHRLPALVLQYRHLKHAKATFVDNMEQHINSNGVIRCVWQQTAAATGRIASCSPNMQTIPKAPWALELYPEQSEGVPLSKPVALALRSPYKPRPGCLLVSADFKHLELRLFAHLSACPVLHECFREPGDIFNTLSQKWLGKSGPEEREQTKRIVYSILYGAGAPRLAEYLEITTAEAATLIAKFTGVFPSMRSYAATVLAQTRDGVWQRTIAGRVRPLIDVFSDNNKRRAYAERQSVNFLIQGSAADYCKQAMLDTQRCLEENGLGGAGRTRLLLQIHDELVWEVPQEIVTGVAPLLAKAMANPSKEWCRLTIPTPVSVHIGPNFADMQEFVVD